MVSVLKSSKPRCRLIGKENGFRVSLKLHELLGDKFANKISDNADFGVAVIIYIQNRIPLMVVSTCKLYLHREIGRASRHFLCFGWWWSECDATYRTLVTAAIVCWQSEAVNCGIPRSDFQLVRLCDDVTWFSQNESMYHSSIEH